jgi:hypothetical protein
MIQERKLVPKWILIVTGLLALSTLIGGVALIFSPETVADSADLTAKGVYYLIHIWAVRQFAMAFIFAFATFKKSFPMLLITYIALLITSIGDIIVGISQKESSFFIPAIFVSIIASVMIYFVNKQAESNL